MTTDTNHPLLDFARKYSDPTQSYLTAYVAKARLESLIEDLEKVAGLLDADEPHDERWFPWFGAEIVSFYAVGMVTCLEWHAKSRLTDLLTYDPSSLKVEDVKGTISDKLIVQMVAKQGSVVQLVGAAVKVNNLQTYISIIGRLFTSLGFPFSVKDWLTGATPDASVCWIRPEQFSQLEQLYQFRHQLVHEIGLATMGHPNVRDTWSSAEARRYGQAVTAVIDGVESAITQFAPRLFPNKLSEAGYPVPITESLTEELNRLDDFTDREVSAFDWDEDRTLERWRAARDAFRTYMGLEEKFIEAAGMLHWRYFDARTPLRVRLIRYRTEFLNELLSHFSSGYADNPDTWEDELSIEQEE